MKRALIALLLISIIFSQYPPIVSVNPQTPYYTNDTSLNVTVTCTGQTYTVRIGLSTIEVKRYCVQSYWSYTTNNSNCSDSIYDYVPERNPTCIFRENYIINNSQNPQNLTDYQISIILNTTDLIWKKRMREDCGDIRVYWYNESSGLYEKVPYYIEEGTCNTSETKIWVRIPFIPANGTSRIYIEYGNFSLTSESNGSSVFDLFDDFEDGVLDPHWVQVTGGWAEADGYVYLISDYGTAPGNVLLWNGTQFNTTEIYLEIYGDVGDRDFGPTFNAQGLLSTSAFDSGGLNTLGDNLWINEWSGSGWVGSVSTLVTVPDYEKAFCQTWQEGSTAYIRCIGETIGEVQVSRAVSYSSGYVGLHISAGATTSKIFWVRVRKRTNPEPIVQYEDSTSICTAQSFSFNTTISGENAWKLCVKAYDDVEWTNTSFSPYIIDQTSPQTSADPSTYTSSNSYNVTLLCSDNLSGCNRTYYAITNSTSCSSLKYLDYAGYVTIESPGKWYICAYSVDNAGNVESPKLLGPYYLLDESTLIYVGNLSIIISKLSSINYSLRFFLKTSDPSGNFGVIYGYNSSDGYNLIFFNNSKAIISSCDLQGYCNVLSVRTFPVKGSDTYNLYCSDIIKIQTISGNEISYQDPCINGSFGFVCKNCNLGLIGFTSLG